MKVYVNTMLFNSNNKMPRKKSYYPFSKNYPGKRGNSYDIGESRTRRKKDERNNIIFYVFLALLFTVSFVAFSAAIKISRKPITNTANAQASAFSGAYKAVYMPSEALDGGIAYDFFKNELNSADANAVLIDFKDREGKLNYSSKNATAAKIGAVKDSYLKTEEIIADLKSNGYKIIARVYCFEDRTAAALVSGAGVREKDSNAVWLDENAQNDGNPWLNPYSASASNYLIDIIKESADLGADMLLLESVCFPSGSRLESAVFTSEENPKVKNDLLLEFIKKAKDICGNIPVAVHMPADKALNGSKMLYDGSIISSEAAFNAIDFRTSSIAYGFEFDGKVFTKENLSENLLIQTAVPVLTDKKSDRYPDKDIIPIIDDSIYISALENLGVSSYILIKS